MQKYIMPDNEIGEKLQLTYETEVLIRLIGTDSKKIKKHIINSLDEKMFTNPLQRQIFKNAKLLNSKDKSIDSCSILELIPNKFTEEFLNDVKERYTTGTDSIIYIKKLINNYINRLIREAKTQEDIQLVEKEKNKWQYKPVLSKLEANADDILDKYNREKLNPIKTGFKAIDEILGSLQGGDYVIIAGAPSMGKTCFALNLLSNFEKMNKKVNFYSLEMSKEQLKNRMICAKAGISSDKIRKYTLTDEEIEKYKQTAKKIFTENINVSCDYDISIEKIKDIEISSPNEIVLIDYLGLIQSTGKSIYESVSDISRELKILALNTNKVFVVLHQLSRKMDDREDKRPRLTDLRDSGKIEQDADIVWLLYRDNYYDVKQKADRIWIIVAKNRHGKSQIEIPLQYMAKEQVIKDFDSIIEGVFGC